MSRTHTVALVGLETIKRDDGTIKCFSDTFLDNTKTWKKDHPKEDVVIIDARLFHEKEFPMAAIWDELRRISSKRAIDLLIYMGHSGLTQLYYFSKVRKEMPETERYFNQTDVWEGVVFSEAASLKLFGCQAAGMDGERIDDCIAQSIANATKRPTYGFTSKSSQQRGPKGGYYQVPDRGGLVKCLPVIS